jgi:hypothetical protein
LLLENLPSALMPIALMPTDPFAVASTCPRRPQPEELELHKLELHCTAQTGIALWDCTALPKLELTAQAGTARGAGTAQAAQSPLIRTLGCQCFIAAGLHELADLVGVARMSTRTIKEQSARTCAQGKEQAECICTNQGAECRHACMHAQGKEQSAHARMHARTQHRSRAVPQQGRVGNCSPLGQLCQTAAVLRSLQPVTPAPCISVLFLLL